MLDVDTSAIASLRADLTNAGPQTLPRAHAAVMKSALDVQHIAQSTAPVDTGYLRSSIGIDDLSGNGGAKAVIGPTANYAPYVEYGTYKMGPRPFMGPAADAVIPGFVAAMASIGVEVIA